MAYAFGWKPGIGNDEMSDRTKMYMRATYDSFDPNLLSEDRVTEEDVLEACRITIQRYGRNPA